MKAKAPSSENDVRQCLATYGIRPAHLAIRRLVGGDDNLNLFVEADGRPLVLRRYDLTPSEEVEFELAVIEFLAGHSFPTPGIHATRDGALSSALSGVKSALFDYTPGRHGRAESFEDAQQVARMLALLHTVTEGFHPPFPRSRTDSGRIRQFSSLCESQAILSGDRSVREFIAEANALVATLDGLPQRGLTLSHGVIHHDPNPGNVLYDEAGRLISVLDFDESYDGCRLLDVASMLHYWAGSDDPPSFDVGRAADLVAAYDRERPLTADERALLPEVILLSYAAGASEYLSRGHEKDPAKGPRLQDSASHALFEHLRRDRSWRRRLTRRDH